MARSFSIFRRRANLIDLGIAKRANVASYQVERAANFDGSFTKFVDLPATGLRSKTTTDLGMFASMDRGYTRFAFNPADYSLTDTDPHWIRIKQVGIDGTVGSAEAAHLVLPYNTQPERLVVIAGTAKNGASIANSLELQLPGHCHDLYVQVDGSTAVKMAFEPGGQEMTILPVPTTYMNLKLMSSGFSQVWIRGAGADTTFSMTFALRQPAR